MKGYIIFITIAVVSLLTYWLGIGLALAITITLGFIGIAIAKLYPIIQQNSWLQAEEDYNNSFQPMVALSYVFCLYTLPLVFVMGLLTGNFVAPVLMLPAALMSKPVVKFVYHAIR